MAVRAEAVPLMRQCMGLPVVVEMVVARQGKTGS